MVIPLVVTVLFALFREGNTAEVEDIEEPGQFKLYRPFLAQQASSKPHMALISSPEIWVENLLRKNEKLDLVVTNYEGGTALNRSRYAYGDFLAGMVVGLSFGESENRVCPYTLVASPVLRNIKSFWPHKETLTNTYWPYLGMSMAGTVNLALIQRLLEDVFNRKVPGAFVETGVWRGGTSIFARGMMRAYGEGHRLVYACDSFEGLPEGNADVHERDVGWHKQEYLSVDDANVANNFQEMGLLDENVVFVKGFFSSSLPALRRSLDDDGIAILRLDGDLYQSASDALYNLYASVQMGGYIIVDDYFQFPAKEACEDFFDIHGLTPVIYPVGLLSVYWQKTEDPPIKYWRYEQSNFKPSEVERTTSKQIHIQQVRQHLLCCNVDIYEHTLFFAVLAAYGGRT